MAYAGNRQGPSLHTIIDHLHMKFGFDCGYGEVLWDIAFERQSTQAGQVQAVLVDAESRPYLEFGPADGGKRVRHCFDGMDELHTLHGDIEVNEEGKDLSTVYREDRPGHWVKIKTS